ncbi:hypothetical protein FA09DRAFT_362449 [Tilletiopsis washingtonensis]|uniref:Uncharacterized protein n=1 Tax=Tilletiopsis washingtonensis TaxID=58919 RepID=A0A316Z6C2_9BASI|nr:hypothetical protein FA09DRAFT_362449 [Tilletiopsis washingtonensis]PWN95765.1 hypothetical protein FA09DRAFT_362449 [Tilletiopsis washingtonensis]
MKFVAAALALVSALALVAAADDRQTIDFTDADGGEGFCKKWKCACINYVPNDSSLYFQAAYCQPGDARNNARDTTARVFCSFTDGTNKKLVNKHIAAATGGHLHQY